jgi:1,4-dihydroxy-2-naphthoate octaprenyltransferase
VTQAGLLTPRQVAVGLAVNIGLVVLVGAYLVVVGGPPVLVLGTLAILSAVAYTGGPFPLGYHGLGDLFVFLFFGLAAVCGTYYVQAGEVSRLAWWSAVPVGALVTAILVVNNLRDIESDRRVGKRTLAVRLGARGAKVQYLLLLGVAYLAPPVMSLSGVAEYAVMLSWLSLALVRPQVRMVLNEDGRVLNKALAGTARLELVYSLLFSVGLIATHLQ